MKLGLIGFTLFLLQIFGSNTPCSGAAIRDDSQYCYNIIKPDSSSTRTSKVTTYNKCIRGNSINYRKTIGTGRHNMERICYQVYKTRPQETYTKCILGDKITYEKNK